MQQKELFTTEEEEDEWEEWKELVEENEGDDWAAAIIAEEEWDGALGDN